MTWVEFDEFMKRMESDLAATEIEFEKIFKRLTNRIYGVVKSSILDKMDLDDAGNAILSDKNISLLTKLNKIIPGINVSDLLSDASNLFLSVIDISSPYFAAMTGEMERIEAIKADIIPELQRRAKVFKTLTPARQDAIKMRKSLIKGISKGNSFREIMKSLKDSPLAGTPLNHAKTELRDAFMEGDRLASHRIAEGVGLSSYYRYTGGLIQRSRDFCEDRNRKVFTRKEVLSWKNISWQGKSKPYNPFINVGGYNCRHRLLPISKEMYERAKGMGVQDNTPKQSTTSDSNVPLNVKVALTAYESKININVDRGIFEYVSKDVNLESPVIPVGKIAKGAYFDETNNSVRIPIDDRRRKSKWYSNAVVYHEFGHASDNRLNLRTDTDLIKLRNKYKKILGKNKQLGYKEAQAKLTKMYYESKKDGDMDTFEKVGSVADTLLSLNVRFGWGHGRAYMRKLGMSEAEFIAHSFENKFAGNNVFKEVLPELYDDMIKWVEGVKP